MKTPYINAQGLLPVPYGSSCCTYRQLKYSSPNRSKQKQKDKSHTKEPTFPKMEVWGESGQENVPKAEKDKTERATGLGRRTSEEIIIETWDQTDSPEISEMGETSEIPRPPFWGDLHRGMYERVPVLLHSMTNNLRLLRRHPIEI